MDALLRTSATLPKEIVAGRTVIGELTVTNPSSRPAPATALSLSAPDGWTAALGAAQVPPLGPGESAKVPLTVTAAAAAPLGDHALALRLRTGPIETTTALPLTVNLPNLSLGKPATQKSTGYDAPAARAVDANTDGNWSADTTTHTAEPENQAW